MKRLQQSFVVLLLLLASCYDATVLAALLTEPIFGSANYTEVMWDYVGEESCLRELITRGDEERVELIFLLSAVHIAQKPLSEFCSTKHLGHPKSLSQIKQMFDQYTHYRQHSFWPSQKSGRLGITITESHGNIVVAGVPRGSSAEQAGIRRYDLIRQLGGVSVHGVDEAVSHARGIPGTKVSVLIERGGVRYQKIVKRSTVIFPEFEFDIVGKRGYLRVTSFDAPNMIYQIEENAMAEFKKHAVVSLLLDLRGNPGGGVITALRFLGMFQGHVLAYLEEEPYLDAHNKIMSDDREPVWIAHLPIVVLIDDLSFSVAEMVAGNFQYRRRGLLVGRRTGGKGVVQTSVILSTLQILDLTTSYWFLPNGASVVGDGLKPDIYLDDSSLEARLSYPEADDYYQNDHDLLMGFAILDSRLESMSNKK